MVSMYMRYEYRLYLRKMNVCMAHLHLRSFATINHEALVPKLHDLRRSIML